MEKILFYRVNDPYGCFSNFSPHPINIDGIKWSTSEHYFQAMKFLDSKLQRKAREIVSPMEVAKFGRDRSLPLRPDWEIVKDDVMHKVVLEKVIQNQFVFDTLIETGNSDIIEHTKNDSYWADGGDGSGKNMLGLILMDVRKRIEAALQKVKVVKGDITKSDAELIVNAANKSLTGGGGVDGAIHRAAGSKMKEYCAKYRGCETGEARVSLGYDLKAKYVVHSVGPVWYGGENDEDEKLRSAYGNSMILARELNVSSVALPNISTGAFRFPYERASFIQRHSIISSILKNNHLDQVEIVCFSEKDFDKTNKLY